jgi:hypothetical protein
MESLPTIEMDKDFYRCYDIVFLDIMSSVSGISDIDKEEILLLIKNVSGGYINMSGYFLIVWNKYFKEKFWIWPEYEKWYEIFNEIGRFPVRFPVKNKFTDDRLIDILNRLKASDLKELCESFGLNLPEKIKKSEMANLLFKIQDAPNCPIVKKQMKTADEKYSFAVYSCLIRTINFRAGWVYDLEKYKKLGVKDFEVFNTTSQDEEFFLLAKKLNQDKSNPLYPSWVGYKK